jgi:hypothetical protein
LAAPASEITNDTVVVENSTTTTIITPIVLENSTTTTIITPIVLENSTTTTIITTTTAIVLENSTTTTVTPIDDSEFAKSGTVLTGLGLANYYGEMRAASRDLCFTACLNVSFCAGATFKLDDSHDGGQCYLVKYGLERFTSPLFTSFVKHEFEKQAHMSNAEHMRTHFPAPHNRIVEHVQFTMGIAADAHAAAVPGRGVIWQDMLTPLDCFKACDANINCMAASFHTNSIHSFNCYLYQATCSSLAKAAIPAHGWISLIKFNETTTAVKANFTTVQNVTLVGGAVISQHIVRSEESCFAQCDLVPHCAGATYVVNETVPGINCALFQYGFHELPAVLATLSYTKCLVSRDMENEVDAEHALDQSRFPDDLIKRGIFFEHVTASFRAQSPTGIFFIFYILSFLFLGYQKKFQFLAFFFS